MKHIIRLTLAFFLFQLSGFAQVTDTVSIGSGYANQVWYSLQNDEQGSAPKNNWDIAFDVSAYGASVLLNTANGAQAWLYAAGDTADFATLDTTGLSAWPARYNSDTSWALGAFSQGATSAYDLGWGMYSTITHYVVGDSLYVVKLPNNTYCKLWIQLLASGAYTFRYAHLDNSNDQTVQLQKSVYTGKNFAYYSLQNNMALDREPGTSWDLLFTTYTTFLPQPYTVTGVLGNINVTVAEARHVNTNTASFTSFPFVTPMNEIGYDWKTFNSSTFQYQIEDSLVYFVQSQSGDVWKVIFTGFGGSANGNFIFTKELISATGIEAQQENNFFSMYPNPAQESTTLLFSAKTNGTSLITASDLTGNRVMQQQVEVSEGLQQFTLETKDWKPGIYIISIVLDGKVQHHKLIVQ